jgi:hypothetical protein
LAGPNGGAGIKPQRSGGIISGGPGPDKLSTTVGLAGWERIVYEGLRAGRLQMPPMPMRAQAPVLNSTYEIAMYIDAAKAELAKGIMHPSGRPYWLDERRQPALGPSGSLGPDPGGRELWARSRGGGGNLGGGW